MQLRDLKIWMEANKNLFTREPHITKETEDLIVLGYQGLTDSLETKIQAYGSFDVTVEHQGECWDIVKTFDCPAVKSADSRFYCSECEQPEYFDSELALWEHHTLGNGPNG